MTKVFKVEYVEDDGTYEPHLSITTIAMVKAKNPALALRKIRREHGRFYKYWVEVILKTKDENGCPEWDMVSRKHYYKLSDLIEVTSAEFKEYTDYMKEGF